MLRVGQPVLAEDPTTGLVAPEAVQAVLADPVSPLVAVDLSDGSAITATADHPFWVDTGALFAGHNWLAAGDLLAGDQLRMASGKDVVVVRVRRGVGRAAVYTLTVAKDHTFFVGTARVLVHNSSRCPTLAEAEQLVKNAERVGSALKNDIYHRAPSFVVDEIATKGSVFRIVGRDGVERTLIQVPGEMNGIPGRFEWIINEHNQLTHQLFVRRGTINGIPIEL